MFFFFFNDTATTEIYTLSLHDALPIAFPLFASALFLSLFLPSLLPFPLVAPLPLPFVAPFVLPFVFPFVAPGAFLLVLFSDATSSKIFNVFSIKIGRAHV